MAEGPKPVGTGPVQPQQPTGAKPPQEKPKEEEKTTIFMGMKCTEKQYHMILNNMIKVLIDQMKKDMERIKKAMKKLGEENQE